MSAYLICPFIRPGSSLSPQGYISLQTLMAGSDAALQNSISVRNISQPPPRRVC